jgi:hypothetical protein
MKTLIQIVAFALLNCLLLKGEDKLSAAPNQTILPKEVTNLFDEISATENGVQIRIKEKYAATLLRIDDGPNRQTRSGEIVHLMQGQRLTLNTSEGICKIFYGEREGVTGLVALWMPQASRDKSKSVKVAAKVDLKTRKLIEVTEEEGLKLYGIAGMTGNDRSLVPKGKDYQVFNLNDLLLKVFETVAIKAEGMEFRFKDDGSRYRTTVDGKNPHISEYGETIRIEPGQELKLIDRHGSLTIIAVKGNDGTALAAAEVQRPPTEEPKYSVAAGKIDTLHEKLVSLEKSEAEDFLRSTGVLEVNQKE